MEFEKIMPNTVHGLCTWHIGQNAIKILVGKKKRNCNEVVNGKEILKVFRSLYIDEEYVWCGE
jgi:hypothetical protein